MGQLKVCKTVCTMSSSTAQVTTPIPENGTVPPWSAPPSRAAPTSTCPQRSRVPDHRRSAQDVRWPAPSRSHEALMLRPQRVVGDFVGKHRYEPAFPRYARCRVKCEADFGILYK